MTEENTRAYISDKIGEDYKKWNPGDIIQITAPTGSGKSYFILHSLLKYAIEKGQKILYLVNRKILMSQLKENLQVSVASQMYKAFNNREICIRDYITIKTYQNIEMQLKSGKYYELTKRLCNFTYVVYDECHYFYSDSNFNTSTELSYDFLRIIFDNRIQIFMSATMERMREMISRRPAILGVDKYGKDMRRNPIIFNRNALRRTMQYSGAIDYNYVKLHYIEKENDIEQIVIASAPLKKKWLIFTDNIGRGKKIRRALVEACIENKKVFKEKDVVFIDADYDEDEEAYSSVCELREKELINKRVVITTAVMDNGISFHDESLRNIIIMADTEEEFIQMLGRKRRDGEIVQLYICKRDIAHFKRHLQIVENTLKLYNNYIGEIEKAYRVIPEKNRRDDIDYINYLGKENQIDSETTIRLTPALLALNAQCISPYFQQRLLDAMISNETIYNYAKKFCYFVNGTVAINSFSISRLYYC